MNKRKFPVDTQTFSKVRSFYNVYVDKTQHIYDLITNFGVVFLSRPRRFGKSLLCSTIKSVFQGQKELFEGLAIAKTDWDWQEHPVIHLDMIAKDLSPQTGIRAFINSINKQLDNVCDYYDIKIEPSDMIAGRFSEIISALAKELNKVVVIIDEYDHSLLETIDNIELQNELKARLKSFYGILKSEDQHLRFVFITGITKFSQISLFSGMNQPKDITTMSDFCDICGITQKELEDTFAPEIERFAEKWGGKENYLKRLKDYYDGYNFTRDKTSIYNPYGLLNHFVDGGLFLPYWSYSGAPSFILKYLNMKNIDAIEIENAYMTANRFVDYKDDTISLYPLLYQAGYITIKDYNEEDNCYTLDYPNVEIRKTFAEFLAGNYSSSNADKNITVANQFIKALNDGDMQTFMDTLRWYLHNVDYSLSSKITEYYFEFAVSNIINMLGFVCKNEVHTATGRIDSVIFTQKRIYLFEFKVDKPVESAIKQIKRKDYTLLYANDNREIVKVGVVFSREDKNIIEWAIEK